MHATYLKLFHTIGFCLAFFMLEAQSLNGHWKGKLYQETGGVTETYYFELFIRHTPDSIVGKSVIANVSTPEVRGELLFRGSWDAPVFRFLEYKILPSVVTIKPPNFCIKKAKLTYSQNDGKTSLSGNWEGVSPVYGPCAPGTIEVTRIEEALPEDALPAPPPPPKARKKVVFEGRELEEGSSVEIEAINFAPASAELADTKAVEKLLAFLQSNPTVSIELSGHTDRNPEKSHPGYERIRKMHLQLAEDRLKAVTGFLQENGVDLARIQTTAYGGDKPITDYNSARNRRVEMKIIKID